MVLDEHIFSIRLTNQSKNDSILYINLLRVIGAFLFNYGEWLI